MVIGIDGAFVKAGHTRAGQRHQFEILTGRVEASQRGGEAFAVVRDLDPYAKRRVQAILRRCGRGQDTDLRILSDGEDGLRGVVGTWFGKKCQHRLDWFHVARRIARIEKEFLYLPYGDDFQERLAAHWANLNSMKWMLWNDGVDMAEFGMTRVRIGLFQHALAHPEANSERFESIEAKLDPASLLFVCEPRISQGICRSVPERRAYLDRPRGVYRQSIDQLAHVQEETNGVEPSRSAVLASRRNGDYQRATRTVYRASFSTGRYGRLTPRFLPVSI
jgi:hypothetical protein